ncbi:hypothetical protein SAMN05444487_102173 [Marininema mesophilum]|uniref:SurA N-terminal domain-containing protein n=1 Tax=Marininema mesophilum TaxID=1048340 RepID=A0A1H2SCM7_9BACL|nr:hypothetical protein [Marininema mesophilum]SDW29258.1 hypothetical protein SAMN05444487_102173 [Marininema mesophilum]
MKKPWIIFTGLIAFIVVIGVIYILNDEGQEKRIQLISKQISKETKRKPDVFRIINGEKVDEKDFATYKSDIAIQSKLQHKKVPSEKQLTKDYIQQIVLFQEAKKRHVNVSKKEAEKYAEKIRKMIEKNTEGAKFARKIKTTIMKEQGLSTEAYWKSMIDKYEMLKSIGHLKGRLLTGECKECKETKLLPNQRWKKYGERLVQESAIQ